MGSVFREVPSSVSFPDLEKEVLDFWRRAYVFRRSVEQRRDAPRFVFWEGPPTANGLPHVGHALPRAMKDLIARYKTMTGHLVERKAGWDTHGLPVELEVEKELGINGKPEIEQFGVREFTEHCRASVLRYTDVWERTTERIGFWLDTEAPYITYSPEYVESVWWILRQIWEKGLLYRGHKVMPYCPRCGTSLSSHEVAQGYEEVEDPALTVRLRLSQPAGALPLSGLDPERPVELLVWTTTPWTLPANAGVAVNPEFAYAVVDAGDRYYLLAADRAKDLGFNESPGGCLPGSALVGLTYQPLFDLLSEADRPAAYRVVSAPFVSADDGTGLVHLAPAFGEDDFQAARVAGLPFFQAVDLAGRYTAEVPAWQGQFVKEADPAIIKDLTERGLVHRSERVTHTYPFCWRCKSPLIYYALGSWFVRSTAVKDQLLANNRQIRWYPEHIRDGRFGNFLENLVDWCIGRQRYWGTPLNIWTCVSCGHEHCVGSFAELAELSGGLPEDFDPHRPGIDTITWACPQCGGTMRRESEVIDCWFDSGSMPFARWHYPFENRERFEASFPADYICEAIEQTRGWFLVLLIISTIITGRPPFRNVLVTEFGLDDKGLKMSKSKGNTITLEQGLEQVGADALRWFLFWQSPPWVPKRFDLAEIGQLYRATMGTFWNCYSFLVLYANLDGWEPGAPGPEPTYTALDRWILSRLASTTAAVRGHLDDYQITPAARALELLGDDLSNWYLRLSRRRFWQGELDGDKQAAYQTLYTCLVEGAKLFAPFTPFVAEAIYRNLAAGRGQPESVHLCDYPAVRSDWLDARLEERMAAAREFVFLGRAARNRAGVRTRQPLPWLAVVGPGAESLGELVPVIAAELNVKELRQGVETDQETVSESDGSRTVVLCTAINDQLRLEGLAREVVSRVQRWRKELGLAVDNRVVLAMEGEGDLGRALERYGSEIASEVLAQLLAAESGDWAAEKRWKVDGLELRARLRKA